MINEIEYIILFRSSSQKDSWLTAIFTDSSGIFGLSPQGDILKYGSEHIEYRTFRESIGYIKKYIWPKNVKIKNTGTNKIVYIKITSSVASWIGIELRRRHGGSSQRS